MSKKVLFASRRPLGRCENITAIYEAYDGDKEFVQLPSAKIADSSQYGLLVSDDSVPFSPGKLILVTHGASGGKSYGLKQPQPYHDKGRAKLIDYVVSTSDRTISLEAMQHGVSDYKVLPLGMPRMDVYFGKKKGYGCTVLAKYKKSYLYVPTMRKPFEPKLPEIDFDYIDGQLTDDEIMVVKRHMVTKEPILRKTYKHIVEAEPSEPSALYLIDADVVITDYSSILFDAHVLEKSVILFEKDKGFVEVRGMSFPYPQGYASRYVRNEQDLVRVMKEADGPLAEDSACRKRNCGACDGHSTERVVNLIKKCLYDEQKPKERKKRVAVYTGSRNLYPDMLPAIKSMLMNGKPDLIYLLIEDDKFPYWLPSNVKTINVSGQKFFPRDSVNMRSKFTYLAMMRAALAKVLPEDIDMVLSLDCDTVIHGSLDELWDLDLDGYYFSASEEPGRSKYEDCLYTNTGVALYNLKMMRETGKVDEVIAELNANKYPWVEQDVFNYLCQGHILPMPSKYNANNFTYPTDEIVIKHYAGISCWNSEYDVQFYRTMEWFRVTDEVEK